MNKICLGQILVYRVKLRINFRKIGIKPNFNQCIFSDANHVERDIKISGSLVYFSESKKRCVKKIQSLLNGYVSDLAGSNWYSL